MGAKYSRFVPKYFRDFNIEKRVSKQMDRLEQNTALKMSPRHPSTAGLLKKIEGKQFKHELRRWAF
jgi:hypothetical protein